MDTFENPEIIEMKGLKVLINKSKSYKFKLEQPRNQKTRKQETETKKPTIKQPINQETFPNKGIPGTAQHTDSHPCTRTRSWGTRGSLGDIPDFLLLDDPLIVDPLTNLSFRLILNQSIS